MENATVTLADEPGDFYVYSYTDTRTGTVVYVGKGRGRRDRDHFKVARAINAGSYKGRVRRWHAWLAKRLREGAEPLVTRVAEGLTEAAALALEAELVAKHGRKGIEPGGTLLNFLEGGDGLTSADARRLYEDPEHRAKQRAGAQRRSANPEWLENCRAAAQRLAADPEWREKQRAVAQNVWADPEHRAKHRAAMQVLWADPEWREKNRATMQSLWADPERREKQRAVTQSLWADPEYRAKNRAATVDNPDWREKARAAIADPATHAARVASVAATGGLSVPVVSSEGHWFRSFNAAWQAGAAHFDGIQWGDKRAANGSVVPSKRFVRARLRLRKGEPVTDDRGVTWTRADLTDHHQHQQEQEHSHA